MKTETISIERILTSFSYLKSSMRSLSPRRGNLDHPITVIPAGEDYEVVDGFKRLEMLKVRGDQIIPVIIQKWKRKRAKAMMLSLNCRRKTISFYEEALLVEDLHRNEELSGEEIAGLLGRNTSWVTRRLSLITRLDADILPFLRSNEIGPTAAYHLSRLPRDLQMPLFLSAREQKLTSEEVEGAVTLVLALAEEESRDVIRDPRRYLTGPRINRIMAKSGFSGETMTRLTSIEDLTDRLCQFRQMAYQTLPESRLPANEYNVLKAALLRLRRELELIKPGSLRRKNNEERGVKIIEKGSPVSPSGRKITEADRPESECSPRYDKETTGGPGSTDYISLSREAAALQTRSIPGSDRGTDQDQGANQPGDLPETAQGGIPGREDYPGRFPPETERITQKPESLHPLRTGAGVRIPVGLVPLPCESGGSKEPDQCLLPDPLLQPLSVSGSLPEH